MRICKACGKAIQTGFIRALNADWHPEHFVCQLCGAPIRGEFYEHENKPYHRRCYLRQFVGYCSLCGALLEEAWLVDYWGTKYCARHEGEYPACAFCGRRVAPKHGGVVPGLNAVRCPICRSTAVESNRQALPLMQCVIAWFHDHGLWFNNCEIMVRVVSYDILSMMLGKPPSLQHLGAAEAALFPEATSGRKCIPISVSILQGLPRTLFLGVMAHELGHVWLRTQEVPPLDEPLEEGFCQLLCYLFYRSLGTKEAQFHAQGIAASTDPVYGRGFKFAQTLYQQFGLNGLIRKLTAAPSSGHNP